jgi:hypothetical protein
LHRNGRRASARENELKTKRKEKDWTAFKMNFNVTGPFELGRKHALPRDRPVSAPCRPSVQWITDADNERLKSVSADCGGELPQGL